ncbi:MAG: iron export ABC transporter permease subunit FetB [Oculatellaceae cyanobacterium Prado106]|jgi:putative ABC transport system permease protein|nr:iron export ABC transporter permease subunit FetB [Oculatellaceae cyanobacterium Prado106]
MEIDFVRISGALGLMVVAIALSAWQKLRLEKDLAIATFRTILQLLLVGYFLEVVFAIRQPILIFIVIGVMVLTATLVARNRISRKVPRLLPLVGGSILVSTALTLAYVNLLVLRPEPWYEPQNLIPLAGILLGNAMNGAAIAGERFVSTLNGSQQEIETHLSLGATPQQATENYRNEAIKAGLMPTLNTMLVVGIVTLPGVFTGQVLAGASPLLAAAYQVLIMFMLAIATLVTTLFLIRGIQQQFFNAAAQLTLH